MTTVPSCVSTISDSNIRSIVFFFCLMRQSGDSIFLIVIVPYKYKFPVNFHMLSYFYWLIVCHSEWQYVAWSSMKLSVRFSMRKFLKFLFYYFHVFITSKKNKWSTNSGSTYSWLHSGIRTPNGYLFLNFIFFRKLQRIPWFLFSDPHIRLVHTKRTPNG